MVRLRRNCVWLASQGIELEIGTNGLGIEPQTFRTYSDVVITLQPANEKLF